jgi:aryl-alcohol dehydrogenase-like predicted oxidoreductase
MARLCEERRVRLLAYGALAGGFIHERWLGAAAPDELRENRSLVKYRLIIEEFGGWPRFQALLAALAAIAGRHRTTIGAVALRWVLDQPMTAAAVVGARDVSHLPATLDARRLSLDAADVRELARIVDDAPGPVGDVYALERQKGGRHAAIMRYGLNRAAAD